jgi:hypothetical protein
MTIFILGRSVVSIPRKMSQIDKEQKHTNDYFYPRTECNQYSMENVTDEQRTETPMTIFIRGRSVIIILWKMTQIDRKQTQINNYFNTLPCNWLDISGERLKIEFNKKKGDNWLICFRIGTNGLPFWKKVMISFYSVHSTICKIVQFKTIRSYSKLPTCFGIIRSQSGRYLTKKKEKTQHWLIVTWRMSVQFIKLK